MFREKRKDILELVRQGDEIGELVLAVLGLNQPGDVMDVVHQLPSCLQPHEAVQQIGLIVGCIRSL